MTALNELFDNTFFRIPDYQRGYAWGDDQRRDFWEDIANLPGGEGRKHYTGAIALRRIGPEMFPVDSFERAALDAHAEMKAFEVIDGQQRLTTAIILANEFMSAFSAKGVNVLNGETIAHLRQKYIWRGDEGGGYPVLDYANELEMSRYFRCAILNVEPENGQQYVETSYSRNLANAANFFRKQIAALINAHGIDEARRMFSNLMGALEFQRIELTGDYDVSVAFEAMNNRGRPLSNLELLKNRLLYLVELFDEVQLNAPRRAQLRREINNCWRTIYARLGQNPQKVLDDNEFLRAHWIVYFMYSRARGDDYIRFLLNAQFAPRRITGERVHHAVIVNNQEAEHVVDEPMDEEEHAVRRLPAILDLTPDMLRRYVNSLSTFAQWWQASYFPQTSPNLTEELKSATMRLNYIGIGYFRPLVAAALMRGVEGNSDDLLELLSRIEKFIFKAFRYGTARSNFGESEFCGRARMLFRGELTIRQLLDWPRWVDLQNRHFTEQFAAKIDDLRRVGKGFYGWNGIRYFLYEYNRHVAERLHRPANLEWDVYNRTTDHTVSIEHVLPQTPNRHYWQNQFRAFVGDEDEMTKLEGALGNLLPLALSINIRLQNDPFVQKKAGRPPEPGRDGVGGYSYGCAAEVEVAQNADWDAECIYQRSHALMDFMRQRWEIEISPEEERRILDLEFVHDGRAIPPELPAVAEEDDIAAADEAAEAAQGNGVNYVTREMLEQILGVDTNGFKNAVSQAVREVAAELGDRLICRRNGRVCNFTSRLINGFLGCENGHQFWFGMGHATDDFCVGADLRTPGVAVPQKNALMLAVGETRKPIVETTGYRQFWHRYLTVEDNVTTVEGLISWVKDVIRSIFANEENWIRLARDRMGGAQ